MSNNNFEDFISYITTIFVVSSILIFISGLFILDMVDITIGICCFCFSGIQLVCLIIYKFLQYHYKLKDSIQEINK